MITVDERKRFLGTNEALWRVSRVVVGEKHHEETRERERKEGGEEKGLWDPRPTQTVN